MPLAFTEEFNLDNTPKIRTFKGTVTSPITLTGDGPITIEVTKDNEPIRENISGIRQTLSKETSSALNGKVITNISFSVDIARPEIMNFFNNNSNYNISYKLSNGTELSCSDIRFTPVPELPYESPSNTDYTVREVSGTATTWDPVGLVTDWSIAVPERTTKKVKKSKPKKKTLIPLNKQLKNLFK